MKIKKASINDLPVVLDLFRAYLQFYRKDPSKEDCRSFIEERLRNEDSAIFLAEDANGEPMGFTQVYYSFTSVGMARILILNDLYVNEEHRNRGVGRALINAVRDLAREKGAVRFDLETESDNTNAQKLYENYGMTKSEGYFHYSYTV